MRKFLVPMLLAVAMPSADAAPVVASQSIGPITAADRPVQAVACTRYGWRGWGVYPGCFGPGYIAAVPYYAAPPVYAVPEVSMPPRRCWIAGAWRPC
jgi:hypothetical protein